MVYLSDRARINLDYAEGELYLFNDAKIPKIFEEPLILKKDGPIEGCSSGVRSAIIEYPKESGVYYKLKGCSPEEGYLGSEPFGAMSEKKCNNELYFNGKIWDVYEDDNLTGPLEPIGYFKYTKPVNNVFCAILKCTGDTRYPELKKRILELPEEQPELGEDCLNNLILEISAWMGYNQRVLKKLKIVPGKDTLDINNYVVHDVGGGFGIARIDFASALPGDNLSKKDFDLEMIEDISSNFCFAGAGKEFQIPLKAIDRGFYNGKKLVFKIGAVEKKTEDKNSITLYIDKSRLDFVDKTKENYEKYLEGNIIPKPVNWDIIFS